MAKKSSLFPYIITTAIGLVGGYFIAGSGAGSSFLPSTSESPAVGVSQDSGKPADAADYAFIRFGDQEIFRSEMDNLVRSRMPGINSFDDLPEEMKNNAIKALVGQKLMLAEASKINLAADPEVSKKLAESAQDILVREFMMRKAKELTTEEKIKAAYDKKKAEGGKEEVKASHILVDSEEKANQIVKEIEAGLSFEEAAKKYSNDPNSAKTGGDLGYFTREVMVPEFSEVAFATGIGETAKPVKSDFGWHVIKVMDKRTQEAPSLESMKANIEAEVQREELNNFAQALYGAAQVKVMDKDGKELPYGKDEPKPEEKSADVGEPAKAGEDKKAAPEGDAAKAEPAPTPTPPATQPTEDKPAEAPAAQDNPADTKQ